MSYQHNQQYSEMEGAAPQGFAAHPRVIQQKQKFKDPYGLQNE